MILLRALIFLAPFWAFGKVDVNGFIINEIGNSRNYGYLQEEQSFNSDNDADKQEDIHLLSQIFLEYFVGKNSLRSAVEVGDIHFGKSDSGGAQSLDHSDIIELKNLYIHSKWGHFEFNFGLIPLKSDPRGFIIDEDVTGILVEPSFPLEEEEEGVGFRLYYAKLETTRSDTERSFKEDSDMYGGYIRGSSALGDKSYLGTIGMSIFSIHWQNRNTVLNRLGFINWAGAGFDYKKDRISSDMHIILNSGKYEQENIQKTTIMSWLGDFTIATHNSNTVLELEVLLTSGRQEKLATADEEGNFYNFTSISPGTINMFLVSDGNGRDEHPGSPKPAVLYPLSYEWGLTNVSFSLSRRMARVLYPTIKLGSINSMKKHEGSSGERGRRLGYEIDCGLDLELREDTKVLFNNGWFFPSKLHAQRGVAHLVSLALRLDF